MQSSLSGMFNAWKHLFVNGCLRRLIIVSILSEEDIMRVSLTLIIQRDLVQQEKMLPSFRIPEITRNMSSFQ